MEVGRVRAYAGTCYPERPAAFEWQGQWVEVAEVLWQERSPAGVVFAVQAGDGRKYRLIWHEQADAWAISEIPRRLGKEHFPHG